VIKFSAYYYGITVEGVSWRTARSPSASSFTALADDGSGGDTNNDGFSSSAGKGYWNSVDFANSSIDSVNVLTTAISGMAEDTNTPMSTVW